MNNEEVAQTTTKAVEEKLETSTNNAPATESSDGMVAPADPSVDTPKTEVKTQAPVKHQYSKEERTAYLEKKNQMRLQKLIEAGYDEENANNIVAYAKTHRGYGERHYGDLCSRAFCGIVYGFKYHIWPFSAELIKEIHQTCIDFLDNYARIEGGEVILSQADGKTPLTVDTLISNFITPRTPIGRAMYTISRRCEEGPEFALQMVYLCEACVDLLNTNEHLFEPFYHEQRVDDPARPRKEFVRKCRSCGQPLTKNERGYWDCTNKDCKEYWDPEKHAKKRDDGEASEGVPTAESGSDEARPRKQFHKFSNRDRAKFDAGKYKKGTDKKGSKPRGFKHREVEPIANNLFDGLGFDKDGNLTSK